MNKHIKNEKVLYPVAIVLLLFATMIISCEKEEGTAFVKIKNDFNNPDMPRKPPWTICKSSFMGVDFGKINIGEESEEKEVKTGMDYVLMVAAWDDPDCNPQHCLPIASKEESEVVDGQKITIPINAANHQGPCPPEGVEPISEQLYNRILSLWPEYNFKPYDQRTENPQCLH